MVESHSVDKPVFLFDTVIGIEPKARSPRGGSLGLLEQNKTLSVNLFLANFGPFFFGRFSKRTPQVMAGNDK